MGQTSPDDDGCGAATWHFYHRAVQPTNRHVGDVLFRLADYLCRFGKIIFDAFTIYRILPWVQRWRRTTSIGLGFTVSASSLVTVGSAGFGFVMLTLFFPTTEEFSHGLLNTNGYGPFSIAAAIGFLFPSVSALPVL